MSVTLPKLWSILVLCEPQRCIPRLSSQEHSAFHLVLEHLGQEHSEKAGLVTPIVVAKLDQKVIAIKTDCSAVMIK